VPVKEPELPVKEPVKEPELPVKEPVKEPELPVKVPVKEPELPVKVPVKEPELPVKEQKVQVIVDPFAGLEEDGDTKWDVGGSSGMDGLKFDSMNSQWQPGQLLNPVGDVQFGSTNSGWAPVEELGEEEGEKGDDDFEFDDFKSGEGEGEEGEDGEGLRQARAKGVLPMSMGPTTGDFPF
jgi:hypothetical protein